MNCVDDVLITSELATRPSRPPDYEAQSQAMLDLADELRVNPGGVLHKVADLTMQLCHAGSAGISILEPGPERDIFRWHAIAGGLTSNLHGSLPRDASPCGTVIERNQVLLFSEPDRFYAEMRGVEPRIYESLLAPWPADGTPAGTLWVVSRSPQHRFDSEDARIVQTLARFASAAHQTVLALDKAYASQADLEKRVEESAFLLSDAFKVLRREMADREQADSRRRQAERALRETEKQAAVGRLSESIVHQIGNPLDAVSNLLFMAEYAASVPEARQYLARAQAELTRVGRMTRGRRHFDRRSSGAALSDLGEIVDSALSHHEGRIRHSGITTLRRFRLHRPLLCFSFEIRQLLVNLVGNSIEAMKGTVHRRLLVRVCATHDRKTSRACVCITVADTGTGMPAAIRQRLFEPFVTAWTDPGAGLGLWVSREIASKHKGNMQIRSSQGKGTVVAVRLPYLEPSN